MQATVMQSQQFSGQRCALARPRVGQTLARSKLQRGAVTAQAIKLYTNPGSRGKMPEWYLAEVGIPYEAINLDMTAKEHKSADFLAINPFGKVPAMVDGDLKLFESGAILLHVARKYGKVSGNELSIADMWVLFANATMSDAFFGQRRDDQMPQLLDILDKLLAKTPYVAGPSFTVSDVAVGSYLLYVPMFFPDKDLAKYENVWAYMRRLAERPLCPQAYKDVMKGR